MIEMINELTEKLNKELQSFFTEGQKSLEEVEGYFFDRINDTVLQITSYYYEELDRVIAADKKQRKEDGLVVERKHDRRQVLTMLGPLEYTRTYYKKASGGYTYPVDKVVGLENRDRLSSQVATQLVSYACTASYAKSSYYVTGGMVSRQSVMHKIRKSKPTSVIEFPIKKQVPVIHMDADEDHVTMIRGKNTTVPLVSIYEGITKTKYKHTVRGSCKNVIHVGEYPERMPDIWETVYDRVTGIYDIDNTTIYIHGDGADWIKAAKEYFPKAKFVLDRYHVNKHVIAALAGQPCEKTGELKRRLKLALSENDISSFSEVWYDLLSNRLDRESEISDAMNYLQNNLEAISRYATDEEARNGGCTEPHISHVLSSRLSTRPMAWSKETLQVLVPLLTGAPFTFEKECENVEPEKSPQRKMTIKPKYTRGYEDPDRVSILPGKTGKITPLYRALKGAY